ncbi:unnamed protein product [Sphagnum troendelagicum]|uniref:Uncharacterized protein n=1 Tax=Sphagnum troendelagicum TaxID=128251 RepID=A0ABP0TPS0_9BRYO
MSPGDDNNNMEAPTPPLKKCRLSSSLQHSSVLDFQDDSHLSLVVSGCRSVDLREQQEELFHADRKICTESGTLVQGTVVSLGVSSSCVLQKETRLEGSVLTLPRSQRISLEDHFSVEISTSSSCAGLAIEPVQDSSLEPIVARPSLENDECGFVSSSIQGFQESARTAEDRGGGPCCAEDDEASHLSSPTPANCASQISEGSCSPRTPPKQGPATVQETPGAPVKARIKRPVPPNLRLLLRRSRRKLLLDQPVAHSTQ